MTIANPRKWVIRKMFLRISIVALLRF